MRMLIRVAVIVRIVVVLVHASLRAEVERLASVLAGGDGGRRVKLDSTNWIGDHVHYPFSVDIIGAIVPDYL
jgi:hypothetical protein